MNESTREQCRGVGRVGLEFTDRLGEVEPYLSDCEPWPCRTSVIWESVRNVGLGSGPRGLIQNLHFNKI